MINSLDGRSGGVARDDDTNAAVADPPKVQRLAMR